MNTSIQLPAQLAKLRDPARYKVLYGGRGGAKSWGVARQLILFAVERKIRILCAREFQASIADSVHKLLSDQIAEMGFSGLFDIQRNRIIGINGSEFGFEGLRHNVTSIKSYEGVDYCWIEEAQTVSKASWDVLIPTIRKTGSEIWLTFNPDLEDDETYKRFVKRPPPDAILIPMSWRDNPWFPEVLAKERDYLKEQDPDAYLNVWEGHCKQILDGAIYATELRAAKEGNRITRVPYDASKPVHCWWDLGFADMTSIWIGQTIGFEFRFIDYLQDSRKPLNHYLKVLQDKPYTYGTHYLPHDARAKQLGSGRSIEELMREAGKTVQIIPALSIADGINAARTLFSRCYFDEDKCADGLQSLMHYRYEMDEDKKTYRKTPLHDWASHGADAFRYAALSMPEQQKARRKVEYVASGWMA